MKRARRLVATAIFAVSSLDASTTWADEVSETADVETARGLFNEGSAHFQGRRWADALAAFQRSHAMVDSPNTMLMIARSLRELGKSGEAVDAFEKAASDASRRISQGEIRYAPTERAAVDEGKKLRSMLGSVRIRAARRDDATVSIDGKPVPLDPRGEATVLHAPGSATVLVRDAAGIEQRQTVTVLAGATVEMEFARDARTRTSTLAPVPAASPAIAMEAPEHARRPAWVVPAALASGVLTLAGTGVFIGFGATSHSTYESLAAECGPSNCDPARRAEADAAERQQTIANAGLVFAGAAAAATIAFVIIALASPGRL